jgi:hypothetical protein
MCWNAEVSLNTFIFGVISAVIVLSINKNELPRVLILLTIAAIQLVEYYAWRNINNKKLIKIISLVGVCVILFQLIFLNAFYLKGNELIIILILLFITFIISLIHIINNNKLRMNRAKNGHLTWHWVNVPLPLLILIFGFYLYSGIRNRDINVIFIIVLLSISLYCYYKYKTWSSMWCYISNILWLILIVKVVFEYIYLKKMK